MERQQNPSQQNPSHKRPCASTIASGIIGGLEELEGEEHLGGGSIYKRRRQHQEEATSSSSSSKLGIVNDESQPTQQLCPTIAAKKEETAGNCSDGVTNTHLDSRSATLHAQVTDDDIQKDEGGKSDCGDEQSQRIAQRDVEYVYIDDSDSDDNKQSSHCYQSSCNNQLSMKPIKRIHVNETDVKEVVDEFRRNGVPIVITGHRGWVNFAKPWLTKVMRKNGVKVECSLTEDHEDGNEDIDLADLHYEYILDVEKMTSHLGEETVSYSLPDYDETNPISGVLRAKHIFAQFGTGEENENSKYYLSQWQFTLSDTAAEKLCHQCKPLPFGIFGEDMLKYYKGDELPHCYEDNPYQYLFMGNAGSTTKLHVDRGGLDITIAPIVGQKECILVHRDDGHDCFYDLDADLDYVDLDKYPLMSQARIWKTVVKPGEILLMPQETYHKCTNVSPCLSYSRFVLDTVNLIHFYRFKKGDELNGIDDMDHEKVLWNCACELHHKISEYTDDFHEQLKNGASVPSVAPFHIEQKVNALQSLRHVLCDLKNNNPDYFEKRMKRPEYIRSRNASRNPYEVMVGDIDSTLHSYQHRHFVTY